MTTELLLGFLLYFLYSMNSLMVWYKAESSHKDTTVIVDLIASALIIAYLVKN